MTIKHHGLVILGLGFAVLALAAHSQGRPAEKKAAGREPVIWKQEPTSFIGITLDQPLTASAKECPRELASELCIHRRYDPIEVCCVGIEPFRSVANVRTSDSTPEGRVGLIELEFESRGFARVADILIVKYGKPHKREVGKVRTKGGAEFESVELSWVGARVRIVATSLSSRYYSELERRLVERGSVEVWTASYARQEAAKANEAARKGAGKL